MILLSSAAASTAAVLPLWDRCGVKERSCGGSGLGFAFGHHGFQQGMYRMWRRSILRRWRRRKRQGVHVLAYGDVGRRRHEILKSIGNVMFDGRKEEQGFNDWGEDERKGKEEETATESKSYLFRSIVENMCPIPRKSLYKAVAVEVAPVLPALKPVTRGLTLGFATLMLILVLAEKWWWNVKQDARGTTFNIPERTGQRKMGFAFASRDEAQAQQSSAVDAVLLTKDLGKKETVEWVNMVLGKVWKVYRRSLEGWLGGLLQPLIDNLKKPDWVQRVEIKQFYLGDEPLSVRSVERRTSRHVNDLQYHIGLRYTGGARLLLLVSLKFGLIPVSVPVAVRGLDLEGELWVKLRLVPSEPFVGAASWAFVSLPKIKLAMAPFRLLNVMAIPLLSIFLEKLLTKDLPQLFVRPKRHVIDFMKGRSVGPMPKNSKDGDVLQGNQDFAGELSVTLVNAQKVTYFPIGKTDPYAVLILGEQVMRSKRNSETSVFGPPGDPIWNQDFQFVVVDPNIQQLVVHVRDTFGFGVFTVGYGEVDLATLQDTVPTDKIVKLKSGWGKLPTRSAGQVVMRLTYKAYVEDEKDDGTGDRPYYSGHSYGKMTDFVEEISELARFWTEEARKTQEAFLQANFPGGSGPDKNDDRTPRYPPKLPPVIPGPFDNWREKSESDLLRSLYGNEIEPAGDDNKATTSSGNVATQLQRLGENPVLVWLGVAAGIAILVAINLNFSNLFNP